MTCSSDTTMIVWSIKGMYLHYDSQAPYNCCWMFKDFQKSVLHFAHLLRHLSLGHHLINAVKMVLKQRQKSVTNATLFKYS